MIPVSVELTSAETDALETLFSNFDIFVGSLSGDVIRRFPLNATMREAILGKLRAAHDEQTRSEIRETPVLA